MEINVAYGCVKRSETITDESNMYEIPVISKPKKIDSLQVNDENGESKKKKKDYGIQVKDEGVEFKTKKKDYRFKVFITVFAVIILLLTLIFTIFFLISYFSNQAHNEQHNTEIETLKSLLNNSNEKLGIQISKLKEGQLLTQNLQQQLNTTFKISLQERVQDLEQQLNTTINEQASDLQNHIIEQLQLSNQLLSTIVTGWKVANLDMRDSTQQCPDGFKLINRTEPPLRTCGRPDGLRGCVNTSFPVHGAEYSRVCGRIVGYQIGTPSGFAAGLSSIDSHYIAGISLTHGSPRQHIWSLVNAQGEGFTWEACPCISEGSANNVPSFVGNDYFCDSAIRDRDVTDGVFYPDDPLWDGQGCGSGSTCCEFNNPPWFCRQLSQPTTDDIEMRLCENGPPIHDDSPVEVVELYIN